MARETNACEGPADYNTFDDREIEFPIQAEDILSGSGWQPL